MKYVWNFIKSILIGAWAIVAVFTTVCLISYNEFRVTEFGKYSLIIIDNDEAEPIFAKNDLVIIKKENSDNYAVGDDVFFYMENSKIDSFVNFGTITKVITDATAESSYEMGVAKASYSNVAGKADGALVYKNAGLVLSILESRWGFMFFVILPTLFALVYEIFIIVQEVKNEAKKELKEE